MSQAKNTELSVQGDTGPPPPSLDGWTGITM